MLWHRHASASAAPFPWTCSVPSRGVPAAFVTVLTSAPAPSCALQCGGLHLLSEELPDENMELAHHLAQLLLQLGGHGVLLGLGALQLQEAGEDGGEASFEERTASDLGDVGRELYQGSEALESALPACQGQGTVLRRTRY